MNLTQIRYFLSVVENGSMTQAATSNFVSQSAVSKMIKQLENELGTPLFERTGRKIILNRQGKLFYSYASDSIRLLDRGIQTIQAGIAAKEEPFSLLFQVTSPLIPLIVKEVNHNLPNVRLTIAQHVHPTTDREQFDFIISDHIHPERVNTPLFTEEIMLAGYNLPQTVTVSDLQSFPLLSLNDSLELRRLLDDFFAQQNVKLNYQYETDDPATLRELALQGVGHCFFPIRSWQRYAAQLSLAHILPQPPMRTIYLNQKKGRNDHVAREFVTELTRIFSQQDFALK
ncbi:MAG: LysR family transcriptional regulator [Ligilactobacillus saerimneri]|nr:LysR family transcriptional regulator [Ligilactobacillus saerimneri]